MKNKILSFLATAALGTTLFFASCKEDKCKDVTCNNGGTCIDGSCECATGYEGTKCETAANLKWAGNPYAVVSCQTPPNYNTSITASSDVSKIIITNIANLNLINSNTTTVVATVSQSSVTITRQTPTGLVGLQVEGTGTRSSNGVITMSYTVYDGSTSTVVGGCSNTTWTK